MKQMFASLALLTSVCWGQQRPPEEPPELATIELAVSTTFGGPVGRVEAILRAVPNEQYRRLGDAIRFEKIPFGLYDLEVQAAGFSTRRERVAIYQHEVHLWLGLYVSPLHVDEYPEITGSIAPHESNPKDLWVRVVPLYSSDFVEDRVASSGEFHLRGVQPGRYLLLVFNKENLITTKSIDFRGGKLTLDLDLSK
jgi:hypothetical protein